MKQYDAVQVTWLDHCSFDENHWRKGKKRHAIRPIRVFTVGMIVKERKDHIIVTSTIAENHAELHAMMILRSAIVSIDKLTIPRKRK